MVIIYSDFKILKKNTIASFGQYHNPLKNQQKLTQIKYSLQSKNLIAVCEIVPTSFFWVKIDECFLYNKGFASENFDYLLRSQGSKTLPPK
jgi:hypothetical protein